MAAVALATAAVLATDDVHLHGELYYFVSRGIPGTAMPSWRSALSSRERWHLVHYLRELAAARSRALDGQ
ncbi:MAG TPA: cytochrome c [Planctomycetota bacterium]|nr:cytochrome c [Planctomycetota bacterium]